MLQEAGSMTQRELTERMGIQPGSASEVIGKLESAGLIVRTPSQTDRRTADVQLTEEGIEKALEAVNERKLRRREMFSCLSPEEKVTLLELTEKLNADWNERYSERVREREVFEKSGKFSRKHGGHCES